LCGILLTIAIASNTKIPNSSIVIMRVNIIAVINR
jgi:hypothetical protein